MGAMVLQAVTAGVHESQKLYSLRLMGLAALLLLTLAAPSAAAEPAPGVPELIEALADPDRSDWARDLLREREPIDLLIERLRHSDNPAIRAGCAFVLGKIRTPRALPALREALADAEPQVRQSAAAALAELAHRDALPELAHALADPDIATRATVVRAIGELGDPAASRLLARMLLDASEHVRNNAVVALDKLNLPELAPLLLGVAQREPSPQVRALAFAALGNLERVPGAVAHLVEALDSGDATIRRAAVMSLRRMSREGFGYDFRAPDEARREAVAQWRRWAATHSPHGTAALQPTTPRRYALGFDVPAALPARMSIAPPWPLNPPLWPMPALTFPSDTGLLDEQPRERFDEGTRHLFAGRYDDARQALEEAIALHNPLWPAHHNLGLAYRALGKDALAEEHLAYAAELSPASAPVAVTAAWRMAALGGEAAGMLDALEAVALPERNVFVNASLGAALFRLERFEDAARFYAKSVVETGVLGLDLREALALSHWRAGAVAEADRVFDAMMKDNAGDTVRLLLYRAEAAMRLGDAAAAEERLLAVGFIEGHPEPGHAHRLLAEMYLHRGALAEAATQADTLLAIDPGSATGLWMSAWLRLAGDTSMLNPMLALAFAERAVEADPQSPAAAGVLLMARAAVEKQPAVREAAAALRERFADNAFIGAVADAVGQ